MRCSQRENAGALSKKPRWKSKRTRRSQALVKRTAVGECDQCEMTLRWKNLPTHYAAKHKTIYDEQWRERRNGELIDHAASLLIKKRHHARISAREGEADSDDTAATQAKSRSVGRIEGERIGTDSADPADGAGVADVEQPTTSGDVADVEQPTTSGDVVDVEQPTTSGGVADVEQPTTSGGVVDVEQATTSGDVADVEEHAVADM